MSAKANPSDSLALPHLKTSPLEAAGVTIPARRGPEHVRFLLDAI
jgi:hypothetical protein